MRFGSNSSRQIAPRAGLAVAACALVFLPAGSAPAASKPTPVAQSSEASSSALIERIIDRWTPVSSELKQDVAIWRAQFRAVLDKSSMETLQTIDGMPAKSEGPNHTLVQAYGYAFRLAAANAGAALAKSAAGQATLKLGSATSDLVYVPITPCRAVDTRIVGGPINFQTQRDFFFYSDGANGFAGQGGDAGPLGTTCPSTVFAGGTPPAAAAATVTAVNTTAAGNFVVWGGGPASSAPTISALNWDQAGQVIANTTIIPGGLRAGGNLDFTVRYNGPSGSSNVVVDIVGYFIENTATALDCTTNAASVSIPSQFGVDTPLAYPGCPAGYTRTGGFCNGGGGTGTNGVYLIETGPATCTWRNTSGAAQTGNAVSQCCRVPGR
jgi:hypothetical protein